MQDDEGQGHVRQLTGVQSCAEEGRDFPSRHMQMQKAGAACKGECDLNAVDTVWHDAMSQYVGRLSPRAALETECRVNCAEEGTEFPLAEGAIWPEPASKTAKPASEPVESESCNQREGGEDAGPLAADHHVLQITTCCRSPG